MLSQNFVLLNSYLIVVLFRQSINQVLQQRRMPVKKPAYNKSSIKHQGGGHDIQKERAEQRELESVRLTIKGLEDKLKVFYDKNKAIQAEFEAISANHKEETRILEKELKDQKRQVSSILRLIRLSLDLSFRFI